MTNMPHLRSTIRTTSRFEYDFPDSRKDARDWPSLDAEIANARIELDHVQRRIRDMETALRKARLDEININGRIARVQALRIEELARNDPAWSMGHGADSPRRDDGG